MKTLVIINGVTGAIGEACLARMSREHEIIVIGLSRQGQSIDRFCKDGKLPSNSNIYSIGMDVSSVDACTHFIGTLDVSNIQKIIYIHAIGVYPFELDSNGQICVSNDVDGDGIDDRVLALSYKAFFAMVESLRTLKVEVSALIFGGIADKYHPAVHKSWWTVMERIRVRMKEFCLENTQSSMFILNISSVICAHEILTRPFVFQDTDADAKFWLMPCEVAEKVGTLVFSSTRHGFVEDELFHKSDYYGSDYFEDTSFTDRKKKELGIR